MNQEYTIDEFINYLQDEDIDLETIKYPIFFRVGRVTNWRLTDKYNNIDCEALTRWPGNAGIIPCCQTINGEGLSGEQVDDMTKRCTKKYGDKWRLNYTYDEDYEGMEDKLDCCKNTKFKGISMGLSLNEINNLPDTIEKKELLEEINGDLEYYKISNEQQLMSFIQEKRPEFM